MGNYRTRLVLVMAGFVGFVGSLFLPWDQRGGQIVYGFHFLWAPFLAIPFFLWGIFATGKNPRDYGASWSDFIPIVGLLWTHVWLLTIWVHWSIPKWVWRRVHSLAGLIGVFGVLVGWWSTMTPESVRIGFVIWCASILLVVGLLSRDWGGAGQGGD